ncbi:MAG: hypothetical protein IBX39_08855 [Candidatus Methanoperedenaceae archaeon]|nr:hypothetical protein [Candidatus Methanoperedenaceae archaeon]
MLGQLLPRDASKNRNVEPEPAFRYKEIRRVTLPSGIKAVKLPDGRMMAKSLDRKQGKPTWIIVRG